MKQMKNVDQNIVVPEPPAGLDAAGTLDWIDEVLARLDSNVHGASAIRKALLEMRTVALCNARPLSVA